MLIDWFTVIAQIMNFVVLVFLLRRFLYGRILRALDLREKDIGERFKSAQDREKKSAEEAERLRRKEEDIEKRREELLAQARDEADAARRELLEQARREVEARKALWQKAVSGDRDEFLETIRDRARREFFRMSKKALQDLASADLEGAVVRQFLNRLRSMPDSGWRAAAAGSGRTGKVLVSSSFDIREPERTELEALLKQHLGGAEIAYSPQSGLIAGIEVSFSGERFSWDIDSYLDDLERRLGETFDSIGAGDARRT